MAVPYTFGTATSSIPLSQLDSNFATAITLGSTNVYLGNTTTTLVGFANLSSTLITSPTHNSGTTLSLQTGGTTGLYIDASQNVGIGTSSPSLTLNVKSPSGEYRAALFQTASTLGPSVQIQGSRIYELRSTDTGAGEGGGLFFIYDKTAGASRVTVDASGNVGIGTTSPGALLELSATNANVYSAIRMTNTTGTGTTAGAGIEWAKAGTVKSSITANTFGNDYMAFNVNGNTERMRIDTSGNLLVGTTSASAKTTIVSSPASQGQISFQGSTQITIANGANATLFGGGNWDGGIIYARDANNTGNSAFFAVGGGGISLIVQFGSRWSVTTTPSAGNFGLGYNGTSYTIYNNYGSSTNFQVGAIRMV